METLLKSHRQGRVRWDRMGRWALLAVLAVVLALYVQPALSYLSTWQESQARDTDVSRLQAENQRLRERRRELRSAAVVEREARRLGMVRPGERAYVIDGLPPARR
ncbi:MAG TPA: septum formation initiator family protein [Solirubrobacteraceae bacterium]|nr:septum formation initiator family protein [Solirubrobacteraceae bacterium]